MSVSTLAPEVDQAPEDAVVSTPPGSDGTTGDGGQAAAGEINQVLWVDPASLRIGPNVRQDNAEPTAEQVRSIKKNGVQSPIKAYRDETGALVVIYGQLRILGAIKGGVELVPVWVVEAPSGDDKTQLVERIVTQFSENRHRRNMTRNDEFRAMEQLELAGMSPTAIGRALSVRKPEVLAALAVGRNPLATQAADEHGLTLEQAAVIAEFEDYGDEQSAEELLRTAVRWPSNFDTLAQRKRNDRAEAERFDQLRTALVEQLTAAGVALLDDEVPTWTGLARSLDRLRPSEDDEPGTEFTVEAHAGCPGHGAWIEVEYDEDDHEIPVPVYGCADYAAHGHALLYDRNAHGGNDPDGQQSDTELDEAAEQARAELERAKATIQRRWVRNNNKDADAALPGRRKWLAAFASRSGLPKGARRWLALRAFDGDPLMHQAMQRRHQLAHELLGVPVPTWSSDCDVDELERRIAGASDAKAAVYELFLVLCAMEEAFTRDSWRNPTSLDKVYMARAIELGYPAPDVDRKVLHPDNLDDMFAAELGLDRCDTTADTDDLNADPVDADLAA
jgi:ParB family transcriptional regulator, chromosome partitioning protein